MIKAKFNWSAYLSFFFILAFLSISIYLLIHPNLTFKSKLGFTSYAPVVGFIFLILTIFLFRSVAKVIYLITIERDTITIKGIFKKKIISSSEIKSINLFSKEDFYWSAGTKSLGIRIELENDQNVIIADPFYSNIEIIKSALVENFEDKIIPFYLKKSTVFEQTNYQDDFEKFAGNPVTSINGILLIGITLMLGKSIFDKIPTLEAAHLFLIIPLVIFYLALGYQLSYFLVSNKQLIVKNHLLPWVNKEYDITNIVVVNFEHPNKSSQALRITTNDFKSKLFYAGSLRDKHWIQLKEKLEAEGIIIV